MKIGPDSLFLGTVERFGGQVVIGARSYVGPGTVLWVRDKIAIGDDVMISFGCTLMDTAMHSLTFEGRKDDVRITREGGVKDWSKVRCAPIEIRDRAWIGCHCIVLAGSIVGEEAVLGAGSVLRGEIPPKTVWMGNPARQVMRL